MIIKRKKGRGGKSTTRESEMERRKGEEERKRIERKRVGEKGNRKREREGEVPDEQKH